jgi:flagellar biosynthetic protein FlhB
VAGERTEQASPRRRQKARDDGDRPRSRELLAACATLAGTMTMGALAPGWMAGWMAGYRQFLRLGDSAAWRERDGVAGILELRSISVEVMLPLCALLAACAGAALLAGVGQGGGVSFHAQALQPKWSRLDPVSNLKNLFSMRAGSRLAKSLVPVAVLSALAWMKLSRQMEIPVFSLARMPGVMTDAYDLLVDAAWILCVWSAIDFAVEWRSWTQRLRMSKQELRDEYKETEGNPQIRGRIRNLRRQMRVRMIRGEVARSSVVITNPTHYAVALSFDFTTMDAPRVLVKGRNLVAEQIKSEARWSGVPIVENPPLARSLYRTVEAGQAIPFELYAAVAGILAYLYRQHVEERVRKQPAAKATSPAPPGPVQPNPVQPDPGPGTAPPRPVDRRVETEAAPAWNGRAEETLSAAPEIDASVDGSDGSNDASNEEKS